MGAAGVGVVWKYPVNPGQGTFERLMPAGARVLSVQVQRGEPFMWALVNPATPYEKRTFVVVGTGADHVPAGLIKFIGTFQLESGCLVFHLFEVVK